MRRLRGPSTYSKQSFCIIYDKAMFCVVSFSCDKSLLSTFNIIHMSFHPSSQAQWTLPETGGMETFGQKLISFNSKTKSRAFSGLIFFSEIQSDILDFLRLKKS